MLDELQRVEPKAKKGLRVSKLNPNLWTYLIGLCLFVCVILLFAPVTYNIIKFKLPAKSILDTFMERMALKDFESAYSLYSPQAQQKLPISDLKAMTHGSNFTMFEGYDSLSILHFHLLAAMSGHPKLPDFTANIDGIILYKGKITRQYNAVLVMKDESWVIESVEITLSPSQP